MTTTRHNHQSGFTLIEIVFAGFIFAVTATALSATLATGDNLAQNARKDVAVHDAVRGVLADIDATPFAEVAANFHLKGFDVPGLKPVDNDKDGLVGEIIFSAGPGTGATLYRVTVRVRWRDRTGDRTVESVRLLSNVRNDDGNPTPIIDLEQPAPDRPPHTTAYVVADTPGANP